MTIMKKISTSLISASILASVMAPSVFATEVKVADNGALSDNTVWVNESNTNVVSQKSTTVAATSVTNVANSGGNEANGNTGSGVVQTSGAATATTTVTVTGGSNTANVPENCGCANPTSVNVHDNGFLSDNFVKVNKSNFSYTGQKAQTFAFTDVLNVAASGKLKAKWNTNSLVSQTSGPASATSTVSVTGGSNQQL